MCYPLSTIMTWKRRVRREQRLVENDDSPTKDGSPCFMIPEAVMLVGEGLPHAKRMRMATAVSHSGARSHPYWRHPHLCVCAPLRDFKLVMIISLNFCPKMTSAWFWFLFPLSNLSATDFDVWCPCDVKESVCMIVYHCSDPFQIPQEERGRDLLEIMLK